MTVTGKLLDHWLPPQGAGAPVACLATSFTFDADFFTGDCLARFLGLTSVYGEGDGTSDIALMLEEEERLSEAKVTVLADRSCSPESRNLRWDLLTVTVPSGLLHAKVAVLVWEKAMRVILGSANLTRAGYRRQVELAVAIDIGTDCQVPEAILRALTAELRLLVELAPGATRRLGAKSRALGTLDLIDVRISEAELPAQTRGRSGVRVALAPSAPGRTPLNHLGDVWKGAPPRRLTALSPFWDSGKGTAIEAITALLARRAMSGVRVQATFVLPVEQLGATTVLRAPKTILEAVPARMDVACVAFRSGDDEDRLLHAKVLLLESDDWVAAMIGSSNCTEAGLGLHPWRGHHEVNLWIGAPAGSETAKALRSLIPLGEALVIDDVEWDPGTDEDEDAPPPLPRGFVDASVAPGSPPTISLDFEPTALPDAWTVSTPTGDVLGTAASWQAAGSPRLWVESLPDAVLPSFLAVVWTADDGENKAAWPVNVTDPAALPPPEELRTLSVDVLLGVLASTRSLPEALERELRGRGLGASPSDKELDPLRRFDSSHLLLQRSRRYAAALWGLERRCSRPLPSMEALEWRLAGSIGPVALARALIKEAAPPSSPIVGEAAPPASAIVGEAEFLLGELALSLARTDWSAVASRVDIAAVRRRVGEVIRELENMHESMHTARGPSELADYVERAFAQASR